MKNLVIDLDNTLTIDSTNSYEDALPNESVINRLKEYKERGFEITIHTARNMRTYKNDLKKINANTLPIILKWLDKHDVPYDGIIVGKPWCGKEGFYIDDKSIRPSEFIENSYEEILQILEKEKVHV